MGVAGRWEVPFPAGRMAATRWVAPAATAQNSLFASRWPAGILAAAGRAVLLGVKIVAPFPNVAVHIAQAPRVRLFFTDRMRGLDRVVLVPGTLSQLTSVVADRISAARFAAARVFPFGFGGKSIAVGVEIACQGVRIVTGLQPLFE